MATSGPCLDFTGRRVVVAGGSRGIGRAMALAFAGAGADVAICARGQDALDETRRAIEACGVHAHASRCDLADAQAIAAWIPAAAEALGGIDVLVNNGTGYGFADDDESWVRDIDIDLLAAVRASRAALPWLKQASDACILHIVSIGAMRPRPHGAPYAAVKAALMSYTGSQAMALSRDRIRVNAIAPGSIEFPGGVWERVRQDKPDLYQRTLDSIPFGRFGHPEAIADAALFLASPLAAWVTGHTLVVDGGQLMNS